MANPNLPINARYNTYIGARYVPKFADPTEWSNQQTYEPLTIVTYQGNSYTSKTFVPVGIDILNTTYWAETGAYNAQVEAYRQQVIALQNTVEQLQQQVNDNELKRIFPLYSSKFILIGDSFGQSSTSWIAQLKQRLNLTEGVDVWSSATGGDGFCQGTTFKEHLENLMPQITSKNEITHIIVIGGINDTKQQYQSQYLPAVQTFIQFAKSNFSSAKIYIGYNATLYRATDYPNIFYLKHVFDYWTKLACAYGSCNIIPHIVSCLADCWNAVGDDFIHLTAAGDNMLYALIMNALTGYPSHMSNSIQLTSKQVTYENFTLSFDFTNYSGRPQLILNQGLLTNTPGTLTNQSFVNICDSNELPLFPASMFRAQVPILFATDAGSQYIDVQITVSRNVFTIVNTVPSTTYTSMTLRNSIVIPVEI